MQLDKIAYLNSQIKQTYDVISVLFSVPTQSAPLPTLLHGFQGDFCCDWNDIEQVLHM